MNTTAKTIQMLLYDGDLSGVMYIEDTSWQIGAMFSSPRQSIDDLIEKADCKRYGVYLLLSDEQVLWDRPAIWSEGPVSTLRTRAGGTILSL